MESQFIARGQSWRNRRLWLFENSPNETSFERQETEDDIQSSDGIVCPRIPSSSTILCAQIKTKLRASGPEMVTRKISLFALVWLSYSSR
jgi:hypothetical protein